jgi:hypothetical protein
VFECSDEAGRAAAEVAVRHLRTLRAERNRVPGGYWDELPSLDNPLRCGCSLTTDTEGMMVPCDADLAGSIAQLRVKKNTNIVKQLTAHCSVCGYDNSNLLSRINQSSDGSTWLARILNARGYEQSSSATSTSIGPPLPSFMK